VLKREMHRVALVEAATSGNPRFFLGTDSAPHPKGLKEHACGCADFYRLPRSEEKVTLRREEWTLPAEVAVGDTPVVPLRGGETIGWKLV
jgi:dihydroorotase